MNASKKTALAVILPSATLTIMAGSIIAPILNLLRQNLDAAASSVGIIITTHGLFMAIASPLMGSIIDRYGAKRPYVISLICYGLAGGAGLVIDSFRVLIVSRACLGIALAGIFTSINVLILNLFAGRDRNKVMGWRGSAQSLGGIVWPLIGGALGGLSWHLPFAVYMIAIPIGLAAIAGIPPEAAAPPQSRAHAQGVSVFQVVREMPVLLMILSLIFTGSVLLYVIVIFMPQLLETFGITNTIFIGLFIALMTSCGGVLSFFYGAIRNHFSYRAILLAATLLWSLAFICLSLAADPALAALGVAFFGLAQGLTMPTVMVWIGDVVPLDFRGRFSSYLGTAGFIGQFLSPILFSPVLIMAGLKGVFRISLVAGIVWLALIFLLLKKDTRSQIPQS